jgi:hypoxanthine phosphoribosyltransferase
VTGSPVDFQTILNIMRGSLTSAIQLSFRWSVGRVAAIQIHLHVTAIRAEPANEMSAVQETSGDKGFDTVLRQ